MSESQPRTARYDGIRVARLYLQGVTKPYVVDFREAGQPRPVSLIAGPVSTGKSSILEFITYGLGGSAHPEHPEVLAQVTACFLEIVHGSETYVIRRSVGRPSTQATEYSGPLEDVLAGNAAGRVRPILPAGDPESLSSFLLSLNGLDGVTLKEAPTQEESDTDPLSFRDLLWLSHLPNERLDDKNLLFEKTHIKAIKLRQVIDVVFGVHDDRRAELGDRIKRLEGQFGDWRSDLVSATKFVEEQDPRTVSHLEMKHELALENLESVESRLRELDVSIAGATNFATELRGRHRAAGQSATEAAARLRDRETLLQRLAPLRAQYTEDIRKLTMLVEAHGLFDPLTVLACPACFSELTDSPAVVEQSCSLCGTQLPPAGALDLGSSSRRVLQESLDDEKENRSEVASEASGAGAIVRSHLRSTKARFKELVEYTEHVNDERLEALKSVEEARAAEAAAAQALNRATSDAIAPFLTERDELARQRSEAMERVDALDRGLKLHDGLRSRQERVGRTEANLQTLREELKALSDRGSERQHVTRLVSERFGSILQDFSYPKLDRPLTNDRWEPQVRELSYQRASSGARTLLSLAWMLAIFEVAFERGDPHPGFLMIDSPQKNIGGSGEIDEEFADAAIVEGIYSHIDGWLKGPGAGAQLIVVDNDPPTTMEDHVVRRYTREATRPPYGLIDNEVDVRVSLDEAETTHEGEEADPNRPGSQSP